MVLNLKFEPKPIMDRNSVEFLGKISRGKDFYTVIGDVGSADEAVVDSHDHVSTFSSVVVVVKESFVGAAIFVMQGSSGWNGFVDSERDGDVCSAIVRSVVVQVRRHLHQSEFPEDCISVKVQSANFVKIKKK